MNLNPKSQTLTQIAPKFDKGNQVTLRKAMTGRRRVGAKPDLNSGYAMAQVRPIPNPESQISNECEPCASLTKIKTRIPHPSDCELSHFTRTKAQIPNEGGIPPPVAPDSLVALKRCGSLLLLTPRGASQLQVHRRLEAVFPCQMEPLRLSQSGETCGSIWSLVLKVPTQTSRCASQMSILSRDRANLISGAGPNTALLVLVEDSGLV